MLDKGWGYNVYKNFDQISMPSVKNLKLRFIQNVWPVDCPNLTHLELYKSYPGIYGSIPKSGPDGSIYFPHLLEMKVTYPHCARTLGAFKAPSLHTPHLSCLGNKGQTAGILEELWPTVKAATQGTSSRIEPRIFLLGDAEINQRFLARTLMERTRLEDFSTIKVEITSEFFDTLISVVRNNKLSKKGPLGVNQACCSTFKRMQIDLSGCTLKQHREGLERRARNWLDARLEAGVPMERLAILYSEQEGWKELVE